MIAVVLTLASPAHALTVEGKPKVVFHAEGSPGFLTFDGVTRELTLVETDEALTFTVPMDTLQTGLSLRDQHMREKYVQTDAFPIATLVVPRRDVAFPEAGQRTESTVTARFTVHGETRDVAVTYDIRERKGRFEVEASFPFDTSAHGIAIPSYLGVTIAPAMTAEVTVQLAP